MAIDENAPLWVPMHDYLPPEDRSAIRALRASPGVVSYDDFVSAATEPPSWAVTVGPGRAIIDGTTNPWTQGSYIVYSPAPVTVPVQPSHPTQNRLDVLVAHVHDQDNSTEQGYSWSREVVTGNPGSGVPPTIPSNSLPLRGINVPAGATAVRPEHLITFWPWWHNNDLRRPAGSLLHHVWDHKEFINQWGGGGYEAIWFDLQIPPAWRSLALWPFDVVMEVNVMMNVYWREVGETRAYYFPRGRSAGGGSNRAFTNGWGQGSWTFMAVSDVQLFTPGQAPAWNLDMSRDYAHDVWITADTKIYPRGVNTHRIWGPSVEW